MRATLALVLGGLAAVGVLGACFDFDATMAGGPVDGGGGGGDATVPDGGARTDADARDAQAEETAEADAATDAGPDAPPDAAADREAGGYCAALAHDGGTFFCDDFDEHPLPGGWGLWNEVSGTLDETDAGAVSPPNSAVLATPALPAGQGVDVSLRTAIGLPSLPATLRFGFSLQPVQIDTTDNAKMVLGAVDFLDGSGDRYTVDLAIVVSGGAATLSCDEQSGFSDGGQLYVPHALPAAANLTLGVFTDLELELDWTAPGTVRAVVTVAGVQRLAVSLGMTVTPRSLQIGIGTPYVSEPSLPWKLRYDDVRFLGP